MMIEIFNLSFCYQSESAIFTDFCFSIDSGERLSIIGPTGCGKTTLLYLLAGLLLPNSGNIQIGGEPLVEPRLSTGLILQDYGLLPWATAFDNVALGLRIRRLETKKTAQLTNDWLHRMQISSVSDHYPAELSGGQRQRVAIARTLSLEPNLLLMDEPFASLDSLTREEMQDSILRLWEEMKPTLILVTHNIEEATLLGNKIMVLDYPPNTRPLVIDNPGSGDIEYRNTSDFIGNCRKLREILEQNLAARGKA